MGAGAGRPDARPATRPDARSGIGRRQWALAVGAPAAAVPGLLHGLDGYYGGFFVLTVVPLALPPLLGRFPKVFAQACVVIALALVSWSVIGAVIAMYVFLPSAALLLLAAAAGPRSAALAQGRIQQ
ncbi:hypothetical protein [Actinacidiphila glaucinigra]|uniref:hypothetical protein n=1 Tax=Actinacidiphila glaucinigra TaxID=235986 RepID=UPI0035E27F28